MEVIKMQGEVLMPKDIGGNSIKKVGINILIYGVVYGGLNLNGVKKKKNNLKTNNI